MPDDGRDAFRAEIAAFYSGFGEPGALRDTFRDAALLVPVTDGDNVRISHYGGIDWVCAFTSVEEYARFMTAHEFITAGGVDTDREYRYHSLFGWRLQAYAESRDEPTGVAVDIVGTAPMAFPPKVSE